MHQRAKSVFRNCRQGSGFTAHILTHTHTHAWKGSLLRSLSQIQYVCQTPWWTMKKRLHELHTHTRAHTKGQNRYSYCSKDTQKNIDVNSINHIWIYTIFDTYFNSSRNIPIQVLMSMARLVAAGCLKVGGCSICSETVMTMSSCVRMKPLQAPSVCVCVKY